MKKTSLTERFQELAGIHNIHEGNFDELKKHQDMLRTAQDFFEKKAKELGVDMNLIGDFNKAIADMLDDVFKADYERSGGKID